MHQCDEFSEFKGHNLTEIQDQIRKSDYLHITRADPPKLFPHGGVIMQGEFKELLADNSFDFIPPNKNEPYNLTSKTATVFVFNQPIKHLESHSMMTYAQELQVRTREERLAHLYASAHTKAITPGKELTPLLDIVPQKVKSTSVMPMGARKQSAA